MPDPTTPCTNNAIEPFTFPSTGQAVRVVMVDDQPWFVAADVCDVLDHRRPADLVRRMDADEYRILQPWEFSQVSQGATHDPRLSGQQVTLFSEAGLYSAILWSTKPEAKAFRRWVTHEVLPSLRRHGQYALQQAPMDELELAERYVESIKARRALEIANEEMKPKVEAYEAFMESDGTYAMATVGNMLGIGRTTLFKRLRELQVLKADNTPYQRYAKHFKVIGGSHDQNGKEVPHYTTYVHPAGVEFIRGKLFPPGSQLVLVS